MSARDSGAGTGLGTSLRSRAPTQTLALAQRVQAAWGVRDVFDITGLDHLGLPVAVSLRPRGATVRVHAGKGLRPEDAHTGAVMEALEFAACEASASAEARLPLAEMMASWPSGLALRDFAPRLGAPPPRRHPWAALRCELLSARRPAWLPAELLLLPTRRAPTPRLFDLGSNGLASGNTLQEATLHALLEVLERDTVALHRARDGSRPVARKTWPAPFRTEAGAWQRRGVQLHVRWLPNELGLPCFEATLHEAAAADPRRVLTQGWGLHLDAEVAFARAVCEAAQSRLAVILAATPGHPAAAAMARRLSSGPPSAERLAALLARASARGRSVNFSEVPALPAPDVATALPAVLGRLPAAGLGPVFRRRFSLQAEGAARTGLQVVRVVVARSETPVGVTPRVGPRLLARLVA